MFLKLPAVSFQGPVHLDMGPFLSIDSNIVGESLQLYDSKLSVRAIVLKPGVQLTIIPINIFLHSLWNCTVHSVLCGLRKELFAVIIVIRTMAIYCTLESIPFPPKQIIAVLTMASPTITHQCISSHTQQ
jgi:hypothetical protein